jgi:phage regulator Rha-like protein
MEELMTDLVSANNGEVFCDSQVVAEKFGITHARVIPTIEKLISDYSEIKGSTSAPLNFVKVDREYRGQTFQAYLMDRRSSRGKRL